MSKLSISFAIIKFSYLAFMIFVFSGCAKADHSKRNINISESENPELSTTTNEPVEPFDPTIGLDQGIVIIGRDYFFGENRGRCLVCHNLNGQGEPSGFPLDDIGLRRTPEWIAQFLYSPRILRPEVARMPPFRGDPQASLADVVAFLLTLTKPVKHPEHKDIKPPDEPDKYEGEAEKGNH